MSDCPYNVIEVLGGECGRAAVASRTLQAGEIVLSERALVCVSVAGRLLCDDCLEPIRKNTTQCDECHREVGYSAVPSSASLLVRLAAKLLSKKCAGLLQEDQALALERLMMHCEHLQESDVFQVLKLAPTKEKSIMTDSGERRLSVLSDCFEKHGGGPALLRLAKEELGRVSVNAINTCDEEGATGLGLFLSAAMFNHSCCPNIQAWWRGSKLELRVTKRVAPGEELCISYISIDQPSTLRREQLRNNWFFTCHCLRCISGQWDAELVGLRCHSAGCSGAVPPPWGGKRSSPHDVLSLSKAPDVRPVCSYCGIALVDTSQGKECREAVLRDAPTPPSSASTEACGELPSVSQRLLSAQRKFDKGVAAYMHEDPESALVLLEECLATRESILHAFNKELLRTLRYASYASVATLRWSKAYSFLARWLHPMNVMFGAAEVWDIAIMHVDIGLVLEKLGASNTPIPETERSKYINNNASMSRLDTSRQRAAGGMHPSALAHIEEGLRWIWICLGRDCGLPAESSALEACSKYGIVF